MEEQLAKVIQERVGLNEEQSRQAARTALEFLKERLPQVAPLIDGLDTQGLGGLGGLLRQ